MSFSMYASIVLRDQSIVKPVPDAPCGTRLAWRDLMPVISWVSLGGNVDTKSPISYRYTLVELLPFDICSSVSEIWNKRQLLTYAILCSILVLLPLSIWFQSSDGLYLRQYSLLPIQPVCLFTENALLGMLAGGGTFLLIALFLVDSQKKVWAAVISNGHDRPVYRMEINSFIISYQCRRAGGGLLMLSERRNAAMPYHDPFIAAGTVIAILYGNDLLMVYPDVL